jgi:hypothetical protein
MLNHHTITRLQINTTNIDEHIEHIRIVTTPSGCVQRRAPCCNDKLTHNDATMISAWMAAVLVAANDTSGKDRTAQATHRPRAASTHSAHRHYDKLSTQCKKRSSHPHQRRQDSVGERAATQARRGGHLGSSMTRRPASLVSVVNSRIGSQENVDNLSRPNAQRGRELAAETDAASAR